MIKIIRERTRKTSIYYTQEYRWEDSPGAGFSFACNKDGLIDQDHLSPAGKINLDRCTKAVDPITKKRIIYSGIKKHVESFVEPAIGRCDCGREVWLEGFTNTCECGRDYSSSGQQLSDRSWWGEETGEYLSDILRIH